MNEYKEFIETIGKVDEKTKIERLETRIDNDFNEYVASINEGINYWINIFTSKYMTIAFTGALSNCLDNMFDENRETKTVEQLLSVVGSKNIFHALYIYWESDDCNIFNYNDMENLIKDYIKSFKQVFKEEKWR